MKNLIKSLSVLALALMIVVPGVKASTVADAHAAIAELRSLTQVLPVTKPSEASKIRKDLTKRLDEATALLNQGGTQNYYKAAKKIYDYGSKMASLINGHKVSTAEGVILYDMSVATIDCIVVLYCPECVYP